MNDAPMTWPERQRRSERFHFIYQMWIYWYYWSWHLAITDDFGNLVHVNATNTNYSLWGNR